MQKEVIVLESKKYEIGEVVFFRGDKGDNIYLVNSGSVGIYMDYKKPEEQLLYEVLPGGCFGVMAAIEHQMRFSDAVVTSAADITVISADELSEIFRQQPELAVQIISAMGNRMRKMIGEYLDVCKELSQTNEHNKTKKQKILDTMSRLSANYGRYLSRISPDTRDGILNDPMIRNEHD